MKFVNDSEYQVTKYEVIDGRNKQVWMCPIYRKWQQISYRLTDKHKEKRPTYEHVTICDEWLLFSNFRNWVLNTGLNENQLKKLELDKDLISNSLVYSPDTCVFVPPYINQAIRISEKSRGIYPLGVCLEGTRYRANIRTFGKSSTNLGRYSNISDAHKAWQLAKIKYISDLIEKYKNEFYVQFIVIEALENMITNIKSDFDNNVFTTKLKGYI